MKMTKAQKLILSMLCDIYDKLELTQLDTKLLRNAAINHDHTWLLDWELSGIEGEKDEEPPPEVFEVMNYLEMWDRLESAWRSFDDGTRNNIRSQVELFGKDIRFPGFDGNNESDLAVIARLLTDDANRFKDLKGRIIDSHAPLRKNYARMYTAFAPLRTALGPNELSAGQLVAVMRQMSHPK